MASQCLNSRTMIALDDGTYKSEIDEEKDDDMPPLMGSNQESAKSNQASTAW